MPADFPQTLAAFLTWLGTAAAASAVLALLAEAIPGWATLKANVKRLIVFGLSVLLGVGSKLLVQYVPAGVIEAAEPYYQIILSALAIMLMSQPFHVLLNKRLLKKDNG